MKNLNNIPVLPSSAKEVQIVQPVKIAVVEFATIFVIKFLSGMSLQQKKKWEK